MTKPINFAKRPAAFSRMRLAQRMPQEILVKIFVFHWLNVDLFVITSRKVSDDLCTLGCGFEQPSSLNSHSSAVVVEKP